MSFLGFGAASHSRLRARSTPSRISIAHASMQGGHRRQTERLREIGAHEQTVPASYIDGFCMRVLDGAIGDFILPLEPTQNVDVIVTQGGGEADPSSETRPTERSLTCTSARRSIARPHAPPMVAGGA